MKEKESQATKQNNQPAESEQQIPAARNGVFLKRGEGQSFDEFKKVCIQRLIDAGLIKTGKDTPSGSLPGRRNVIQ
jgi:hypothetical protein